MAPSAAADAPYSSGVSMSCPVADCQLFWTTDAVRIGKSSEALPRCLSRHGKHFPDCRPTHVPLTEDVDDILHGAIHGFECTVVSGKSFEQPLGRRVVRQQRILCFLRPRVLGNDVLTEAHALIANEHAGSRNERLNFRLRLPAKGTAIY